MGLDGQDTIPGRVRKFFLLHRLGPRAGLGLTYPAIQWKPGAISSEVKRQEREAHYSPPSNAEVKNDGAIFPLSCMSPQCGT
jgi:hypothetical protein